MKKTSLIAAVLGIVVAVGPIAPAAAQATSPATQPTYSSAYKSLRLTRDATGVLLVELNTSGGPLTFSARDHTDFVDSFLPDRSGSRQQDRHPHGSRWRIHHRR